MAAVDYFLKITGIDGEAQDKTHKNEIHLESFSWVQPMSQRLDRRRHGIRQGEVSGLSLVMATNKASPKLMLACAKGEHIASAILTCRKRGTEQWST